MVIFVKLYIYYGYAYRIPHSAHISVGSTSSLVRRVMTVERLRVATLRRVQKQRPSRRVAWPTDS
jgi:hypothetical protein